MLEYRKGNLLDVETGIIAHGCNCQGVMQSGVALQIKQKYPSAYKYYKYIEEFKGLNLGDVHVVLQDENKHLYVVNLMTQEFYGRDDKRYVSYDAVDKCFDNLFARNLRKLTVNIPLIGAGLANGDWTVISSIIEYQAKRYDQKVVVWSL